MRRRTIRLRHILAGILIEGQKKGDFPPFSVKAAGDLLYSLIESAIFRIAVLGQADVSSLIEAAKLLAASFKAGEAARKPTRPAASSRAMAATREDRART